MIDYKAKKRNKIRRKILFTFSVVLFVFFFLSIVTLHTAMRFISANERYEIPVRQSRFQRINLVSIGLMGTMFVVTIIATYILSNSITRPIEKLGEFALGIGKGDFNPNNFTFKEAELEDLNKALNKSVIQLAAYDNEQKMFFQNASHELRTPLMSIKVYAEGISFGLMEPKAASDTILAETDRLSELVNDLLYIAQLDNITTTYTKADVVLTKIIRDSAIRQRAVADKKQISFIFDFNAEEITFFCVPELIERAVGNLISNALRYAKSKITLSCYKYPESTVIRVADDGDGIDPDILPHIFERFCKGKGGNTGIGLSIVKTITEQSGGSIKAENQSEGGALFTMTLNN